MNALAVLFCVRAVHVQREHMVNFRCQRMVRPAKMTRSLDTAALANPAVPFEDDVRINRLNTSHPVLVRP
jgi:hypothetical protein